MTLTLYGYQVFVRGASAAFYVTCPELPQVSVAGSTIGRALSLAEQAIGAFLMGWSIQS
jgi:predicted RNase H-like HicB family nuclease